MPPPRPFRSGRRKAFALFVALLAAARLQAADVTFKITDQKNEPVADAVVSLVRLDPSTDSPAAQGPVTAEKIEIEQQGEEFIPYVTAVQVGSTVWLPNREKKVEHHVFAQSPAKEFEFPLYKPGTAESVVFDQPGVVAIGCNIHEWMLAYVVVLKTRLFAVTPASGLAVVSDVPAGRYRAEVWHPRRPDGATQAITVTQATPLVAIKLDLKRDQRVRRIPEKSGRGY